MVSGAGSSGESNFGVGIGDSPGASAATIGHPTTTEVTLATAVGGSAVRARLSTSSVSTPPPATGAVPPTSRSDSSSSSCEAPCHQAQEASGRDSSDDALATASHLVDNLCCDGGCPKAAVALKLCGILTLLAGYAAMFYSGHRLIGSLLSEDTTGAITPLTLGILIGLPVALLPLSCLMVACGRCCDGDRQRPREGRERRRQQRQQQQQQQQQREHQCHNQDRNRQGSGSPHHPHTAV